MNNAIIAQIENLPPMPHSALELAALLQDEYSTLDQAEAIIARDPALAANVLRIANSAWSGPSGNIATIKLAVARLGAARVLRLAIGTRLRARMDLSCAAYRLGQGQLWRHGLSASLAAEWMGRFAKSVIPPLASTAALIHDVGKIVISACIATEAVEHIDRILRETEINALEAEQHVLGFDHAQIGAAVLEHWRLPEPLVHAVRYHHQPDALDDRLLDTVHVSNLVARLIGEGLGLEQMFVHVDHGACRRLGMDTAALEALCVRVAGDMQSQSADAAIIAEPETTTREP